MESAKKSTKKWKKKYNQVQESEITWSLTSVHHEAGVIIQFLCVDSWVFDYITILIKMIKKWKISAFHQIGKNKIKQKQKLNKIKQN